MMEYWSINTVVSNMTDRAKCIIGIRLSQIIAWNIRTKCCIWLAFNFIWIFESQSFGGFGALDFSYRKITLNDEQNQMQKFEYWYMMSNLSVICRCLTHWGRMKNICVGKVIKPLLVQIMACRLFGAKSLSESMRSYYYLDRADEFFSVTSATKYNIFIQENENAVCKMTAIR